MNKLVDHIRKIADSVIQRSADINIGISDYLYARHGQLSDVIAVIWNTIVVNRAGTVGLYATSVMSSTPELDVLLKGYKERVDQFDTLHFLKLGELIFAETAMQIMHARVEGRPSLGFDVTQLVQAAALGMIHSYNVQSRVGMSEQEIDNYLLNTLDKVMRHVQGNTTMGADYSDFQCVAVPKLVKLANALRFEDAARSTLSGVANEVTGI